MRPRSSGRQWLRMVGAASVAAVVALVAAAAASAHATLVAQQPLSNQRLRHAPDRIVLRFDESVGTTPDSIMLYDAAARPLSLAPVTRSRADTVAVALPRRLRTGSYVVSWHVISADTHPVHGAFVFSIGAPAAAGAAMQAVAAAEATPASVRVTFAVVRFLAFALLLAAVGGALLLAVAHGVVPLPLRTRLYAVVAVAAGILVPVTFASLPLQAAWAYGHTLGSGFAAHRLGEVVNSRFGEAALARAAVAVLLIVAAIAVRRRPRRIFAAASALLATVLVATPAAAGHAAADGAVAIAADVAHVAAAAAWTGGLGFVVAALALSRGGERWRLASVLVPRFSALAVVSVGVLLVAGSASGYLDVGSWHGLWTTTYGLLLLVKVGLVGVLLAIGAYNNRYAVPRLRAHVASAVEQRRFLRTTGAELALFVGVVAVTAALVQEPTAKSQIEPMQMAAHASMRKDVAVTARVGPFDARIAVTPAVVGTNAINVEFRSRSGHPVNVAEAQIAATLEGGPIGPLRFEGRALGLGRFVVDGANLPVAGTWKVSVLVRQGEFDEWAKTISIAIGDHR